MVEVNQADRDAAAATGFLRAGPAEMVKHGALDDHPLVQAFARHRIASSPTISPDAAGVVERAMRSITTEPEDASRLVFSFRQTEEAVKAALEFFSGVRERVVEAAKKLVHAWNQPMLDKHGYANSARYGGEREASAELREAIRNLSPLPIEDKEI